MMFAFYIMATQSTTMLHSTTTHMGIKKLREHNCTKGVSGMSLLSIFSHDLLYVSTSTQRKHTRDKKTGDDEEAKPAEMHMTAKTFPEKREDLRLVTPVSSLTWHTLAGHWLRSPTAQAHESEASVRRQAAVQRWRGLPPEATTCMENCQP
jgi:hypothetical protein